MYIFTTNGNNNVQEFVSKVYGTADDAEKAAQAHMNELYRYTDYYGTDYYGYFDGDDEVSEEQFELERAAGGHPINCLWFMPDTDKETVVNIHRLVEA